MNDRPVFPDVPPIIAGSSWFSGGGGNKGGDEEPNNLKSRQTARLMDLLGEGPVVGPWDGPQSVYFDGVQVRTEDGEDNFVNWTISGVAGWPAQPVLKGFGSVVSEIQVNVQIKKVGPVIVRTINDPDVDRCRITVSTPALQKAKKKGDIVGMKIVFDIMVDSNGGGYKRYGRNVIDGKTNTKYQRAISFKLRGNPPWTIRLDRITEDNEDTKISNDLYWDTYAEITDAKVNYTLSACMGYTIDSKQFANIPKRVIDVGGLCNILIPSNYDPVHRSYTGAWDGTFKPDYTNNPAWCLNDMVLNNRYGAGDFIKSGDIDKWELYQIAKWCDERVDDGQGGTEPRWVCNAVISTQYEAFDLINTMASVFRGQPYWGGGQLVPVADRPSDIGGQYSNANVVNGAFTYSTADVRARHNQVAVKWYDQTNLGEPRLAIVEDADSISKYGVQKTDLVGFGCTTESQAIRVGKWLLYTDSYEGETVSFQTGLEAAWCRPGNIIQIADVNVGGSRRGGRLVDIDDNQATLDSTVFFKDDEDYYISCVRPSGIVETIHCSPVGGNTTNIVHLNHPFGTLPVRDSIWVIASSDLEPTLWRVVGAKLIDTDKYEVNAVHHDKNKWAYVEKGRKLSSRDISNIGAIGAINSLKATDYLIALSPTSIGSRMIISWQSNATSFDLAYRPSDGGNWIRVQVDQTSHDVEAFEGDYDIWVTPKNSIGRRGKTTKITYTVVGKTAPPLPPANFRIQVINGVAMFQWAPSTEIDVIIGGSFEMRYSPRTAGATWAGANKILTSIPGTATTVEVPYRPGTYYLRTRDIEGLMSPTPAVIVTNLPDYNVHAYVKICEQPTWAGTHAGTVVLMPQQWLIIADPNLEAFYTFINKIDMGGVFPVRLTVDMLAFPYWEGSTFIDDRDDLVDDWQDWDNAENDGDGMVTIQVSQTDHDPATAVEGDWTPYTQFIAGEYSGWGFRFKAWLAAPEGQNMAIEELCILADITGKAAQGADVVWIPVKMRITFPTTIKFFNIPSVNVTIQNALQGDYYVITKGSKTYFDIEIRDKTNAIVTGSRTFDWIATGY
jgi:predicted phage tail protein